MPPRTTDSTPDRRGDDRAPSSATEPGTTGGREGGAAAGTQTSGARGAAAEACQDRPPAAGTDSGEAGRPADTSRDAEAAGAGSRPDTDRAETDEALTPRDTTRSESGEAGEPAGPFGGHRAGLAAPADDGSGGTAGARPADGRTGPEAGTGHEAHAHAPAVDPDARQRVAAVRRAADGGRRWRGLHVAGCAVLLAVAVTGGAVAAGGVQDRGAAGADAVAAAGALSPGDLARGDLDAGIASLQKHLRAQPRDFGSWATLGVAYVEQARTKGDPSRYPQAERALKRSLALEPGNDQALAGRAALAAARHDFPGALTYAERALKQNPYNERALCSRIDALVELGRYDDAAKAADTADDRRPGIPVFTRYAYVHELRGDVRTARAVLERALGSAHAPADVAYVATALGQLAWNQGEYKTALGHYARALAADDAYLPALEGRARAQAASGDRAAAIKGLEQVVARFPLPGPLVALGELYEDRGAGGDRAKAGDQYALVDAWTALARAGGANTDLETAMAAADHGDKKEALRAARAEWDRRHSVHTADALAWALHVNGRDEEALPYARRATATGYRNAVFLYHRGVIERATGDELGARAHLKAALDLNPGFSPLGAREARTALKDLEGNR
ncbi:tetratricopeptide repeat protein [Streptomyces sp. NRRL B-1140]|uniref:tetratricopeptide repeat protein n=1 Tax=Streptomyces sp. NRRL B-1140 TaxID=1415549 RepID=UPI0006AF843E|nr:tetratricopeptide repeat protein [Streptomyces sp. NRRL B-1140]KOV98102.1 tetratricopeptide repeat protein [Streptomyces sp. NRRL B-1140]